MAKKKKKAGFRLYTLLMLVAVLSGAVGLICGFTVDMVKYTINNPIKPLVADFAASEVLFGGKTNIVGLELDTLNASPLALVALVMLGAGILVSLLGTLMSFSKKGTATRVVALLGVILFAVAAILMLCVPSNFAEVNNLVQEGSKDDLLSTKASAGTGALLVVVTAAIGAAASLVDTIVG